MSKAEAFVELALKSLGGNQKELAQKLRLSESQITKWKRGESMSNDVENKLRKILNIDDMYPSFVLAAGSLEAAQKWGKLIHFLAENAVEASETGFVADHLLDDFDMQCEFMFDTLKDMGVEIPKTFPAELDIEYEFAEPNEESDDEDSGDSHEILDEFGEILWETIHENPYSSLIHKIFTSLVDVDGFYMAYLDELTDDHDKELVELVIDDIRCCLMDLAASKIELNEKERDLAKKFDRFRNRTNKMYRKQLDAVKERAFRVGRPLRVELLDMVNATHGELGVAAERESFGFNEHRLHPDIYMNELLTGMRAIHQVLPHIMKKLGIYDSFKLNQSELHNYPTREGNDDDEDDGVQSH